MTPHVSILVLNWNGAGDTIACVRSLAGLTFENRDVVVIDNGSTDGSAETIGASLPGVTLVRNPRNLGFAAGNNVGVRRALARGSDYVWLLNSDTVVEPASLDALVELAESDLRIGIVGSVLRSADGSETVEAWGGGVLHPRLAHAVRRTRPFTASWPWVSGASMLIRAELLASVGLLDERYFFFIEDVDLCYRAVRAGWRVEVAESSVVRHRGGAAVNRGGTGRSRLADRHYARSTGIFLGTHARPVTLAAGALRLAVMVAQRLRRRQLDRVALVSSELLSGLRVGRRDPAG